jgi:hypothetical protein
MATRQTIQTDSITRIYKNSGGATLAIDSVAILETRTEDGSGGFDRTAVIDTARTMINEGSGQIRTVFTIQQIGTYDSVVDGGGSFTSVTYVGTNGLNNLVVDLSGLDGVGSTV